MLKSHPELPAGLGVTLQPLSRPQRPAPDALPSDSTSSTPPCSPQGRHPGSLPPTGTPSSPCLGALARWCPCREPPSPQAGPCSPFGSWPKCHSIRMGHPLPISVQFPILCLHRTRPNRDREANLCGWFRCFRSIFPPDGAREGRALAAFSAPCLQHHAQCPAHSRCSARNGSVSERGIPGRRAERQPAPGSPGQAGARTGYWQMPRR